MSAPGFFGYVRVSTAKQGEGVSLIEQRDAILRYARRSGLEVVRWFEERETAAKRGRPLFNEMLALLRQGQAYGVVIHKIDRSARNLRDWADLGELIDRGVDVRFANESLDLGSRGGRLSADIQAVVAADYIRNLREESRKGIYGRLKQGLYPMPAPLGYLDRGGGKPKEPDPVTAPLVRRAFELYATGRYCLITLGREMTQLGLRTRTGRAVSRTSLSVILNNPFYFGLIQLRSSGETFPGIHAPLIPKSLFDRVQAVLTGKTNARVVRHDFLFRRLLTCAGCAHSLTGERQKGHVYYRCHTRACPPTSTREDLAENAVLAALRPLQFNERERAYLATCLTRWRKDWRDGKADAERALRLRLDHLQARIARLTDAFLDNVIDQRLFEERKKALLLERQDIEERLASPTPAGRELPDRIAEFFELAASAYVGYKTALPDEKRDLLRILTSNRRAKRNTLEITLSPPFQAVADRGSVTNGGPQRDRLRTLEGSSAARGKKRNWTHLIRDLGKMIAGMDLDWERLQEITRLGKDGKGGRVAA